ncbi:anti-phage dCTP deaminase [Sulfitobacter sp. UBA4523]|jgi:deoxycytidylate deaminase|uniref:anti-phage dCTP deaminase n=1 Tax=Sulfitobacter sp. UBA4523 TaxID=1947584 RepID=UPI002579D558|nr:anti-phage dCTP deaminase [Sulfitobacter sp. UBA4523]|tara:strand:+ start:2035 stop:3561 length:1527 start_codon:yes stop_codon:yes gene_type:complete
MEKVVDPELIIGFVGRLGTDLPAALKAVDTILHSLHYKKHHIKITDFIAENKTDFQVVESPTEDRYKTYIDACNMVRQQTGLDDFFVSYAVERIRAIRREEPENGDAAIPLRRTAYLINQIKRPEEVEALRSIYGKQFILISCHSPKDQLKNRLATRIAEGHAGSPKSDAWQAKASELIQTDDKESSVPSGQRVSDVFPLADVIIDTSDVPNLEKIIQRFFHALFGNFAISPTREEFFLNLAFQTSLTSCDTARQVGAAIARDSDIIAMGYNEAPKANGGTYWPHDGEDGRDVALGRDFNTIRKRQMVIDIVLRLGQAGALKTNDLDELRLAQEFLDSTDAPLKKAQVLDTLDYGRAVHAEMAAISTAARLGLRLAGSKLFCTTFPCHNCSKHIVASGISKVIYLEPYSKSFADDLYPDSIEIDQYKPDGEKVQFLQFIGITPQRFKNLFSKSKLKDKLGKVREWVPETAQPILEKLDQGHTGREAMFQKKIEKIVKDDGRKYLIQNI